MNATRSLLLLALSAALPRGAAAADFWSHWGDGRAEVSGYRLRQPRYGQLRDGTAVLIYVTEDFSDSLRVKADPGRHPPADVYPVLKLNLVRKFQTGIYDYSVMTSVFARVDASSGGRPWQVRKVSFSSQEWCGHVYHQLLPRGDRLISYSHSYFDGEADAERELPLPSGGLVEDELPLVLRSYAGKPDLLRPGATVLVPLLPSLLRVRLQHQELRWGRATLTRAAAPQALAMPLGPAGPGASRQQTLVYTYTVAIEGGPRGTYYFEAAPPHRLLAWRWSDGEEGTLLGSTRLKYWELNTTEGERYLRQLGIGPLGAPRP